MAKRKPGPVPVRGKKAPGARKPKIKTPAIPVGETCPYPPYQELDHEDGGLTFKQERFVHEYLLCGGNATEAYCRAMGKVDHTGAARALASRMMKKQSVLDAIEAKREELRKAADITLDDIIRRKVAMRNTGMSQLLEVLRSPHREDSWRGLVGDKEHVVKKVNQGEFGNSIELHSTQEIDNDLVKILGLKKANDLGRTEADGESVHDRIKEILGDESEGKS